MIFDIRKETTEKKFKKKRSGLWLGPFPSLENPFQPNSNPTNPIPCCKLIASSIPIWNL